MKIGRAAGRVGIVARRTAQAGVQDADIDGVGYGWPETRQQAFGAVGSEKLSPCMATGLSPLSRLMVTVSAPAKKLDGVGQHQFPGEILEKES
jgi:hypothetical protein